MTLIYIRKVHGITVIIIGNGFNELNSNPSFETVSVSLCANAHEKVMNPSYLLPSIGKY